MDKAQDDSVDKAQDGSEAVSLTSYSKCHRCHVERSETSFIPFRPLSFRPSASLLSFRPSVPLARHSVLHAIRDAIPVMLSGAKHLSHHSAPLSFRPSGASGEIYLLRGPSSEYAVSDDYSSGAAGSSAPKGSPRAWLLPFSHLLCACPCSMG